MPPTLSTVAPLQYSERDAAERLGICVKTLQRYRQAGHIAFVRIGSRVFYRPESIDAFSKANEVQPALEVNATAPQCEA